MQSHNAKIQSWLKPILFGQCWQENRLDSSTTEKRCSRRTKSAKERVTAALQRVMVTNVCQAVAAARLTRKEWKHRPCYWVERGLVTSKRALLASKLRSRNDKVELALEEVFLPLAQREFGVLDVPSPAVTDCR